MAVRIRTNRATGETSYAAVYYARDGRRVERVRVLKAIASKRAHDDARLAAANLARERRRAIRSGEWKDPRARRVEAAPGLSFPEMVRRFLRDYRPRSGDVGYYVERSKVWLRFLSGRAASAVTVLDVDRMRLAREREVGPSTVRKDLVTLSTLFRWARARGLVQDNPADPDRVRRPSEPKHRAEYLTREQEVALLRASRPWLRRVIRWAVGTGMDREEVVGLTWSDLDDDAQTVHAPRSKTGVPRDLPLNDTLRAILRAAGRVRTVTGEGRVFLGPDGRPLTVEGVKTALRRAYKAAGLDVPGPFKTFRHTFASRLVTAGVPMTAVARLMGHSTQAITDRYAHLSPDYLRGAMGALDRRAGTKSSTQDSTWTLRAADSAGGEGRANS